MGDHFQLLIRNGTLIDGSGTPRRRADVAARDGRIAAIGRLDGATADIVIDAEGRIVAPGIIDPHTAAFLNHRVHRIYQRRLFQQRRRHVHRPAPESAPSSC